MIAEAVKTRAQDCTGGSKDVSISSVFCYPSLKEFSLESYVKTVLGLTKQRISI